MTNIKIPEVAYLGVCESAKQMRIGAPYFWYLNILRLRHIVIPVIYPISLSNFQLMLAIYDIINFPKSRISIRTEDGREFCGADFEPTPILLEEDGSVSIPDEVFIPGNLPSWITIPYPLPDILIQAPERFNICLVKGDEEFSLGPLTFASIELPPLTEDRIAAIRSDPTASKSVRMEIKCKKCGDELKVYCSLDRDDNKIGRDFIWYQNIPDEFRCRCGKSVTNLGILRKNMHALLGRPFGPLHGISFTGLYEKDALKNLYNNFLEFLNTNPSEPEVYKFIKENELLLHQFSPNRIFYKPPITPKYETDIVILNHQKELILIELESPEKQILKQKGGIHHETQHAFDQVRDWLHEFNRNRLAALDCLDLKLDEVTKVKACVIIGRDKNCNEEHLFKVKSSDLGLELLTYDDLLRGLGALARDIEHL